MTPWTLQGALIVIPTARQARFDEPLAPPCQLRKGVASPPQSKAWTGPRNLTIQPAGDAQARDISLRTPLRGREIIPSGHGEPTVRRRSGDRITAAINHSCQGYNARDENGP